MSMSHPRNAGVRSKARYIFRSHYEEPIQVPLPLKGWALRRHKWAGMLLWLACRVRGWHYWAFEPDWKDWFCTYCYQISESKETAEVMAQIAMDKGKSTPEAAESDTSHKAGSE